MTFTNLANLVRWQIMVSSMNEYTPAVVEDALLGTALRHLLLLLLFDLGGLRLYFAGTGERSVNCVESMTMSNGMSETLRTATTPFPILS